MSLPGSRKIIWDGRHSILRIHASRGNDGNERKACSEKGIHGIASELFFCDEEYGSLIDSILGKTLIAENLDVARTVSAKYNYRLRLVTLDGQLVNPGGSLTGGSMRKQENTFLEERRRLMIF